MDSRASFALSYQTNTANGYQSYVVIFSEVGLAVEKTPFKLVILLYHISSKGFHCI